MIPRFSPFCAAALLAGLMIAGPSLAAPETQAPAAAPTPSYQITGFRSAKFGMTQAQVRAAAAADFGAAIKITENGNPAEGTTALQLDVAHLDPGPGAAQVTYIFGATSHTLAHVNVVWVTGPEPTADERAGIVTAAIQLAHYFQTLPEPLKASLAAQPIGPNGLMLFAGVDQQGAGIEVAAEGISYQVTAKSDDKKTDSPAPKGPALLRISYIRNVANPDIIHIKPGAF
jgi:hypothetical protein